MLQASLRSSPGHLGKPQGLGTVLQEGQGYAYHWRDSRYLPRQMTRPLTPITVNTHLNAILANSKFIKVEQGSLNDMNWWQCG